MQKNLQIFITVIFILIVCVFLSGFFPKNNNASIYAAIAGGSGDICTQQGITGGIPIVSPSGPFCCGTPAVPAFGEPADGGHDACCNPTDNSSKGGPPGTKPFYHQISGGLIQGDCCTSSDIVAPQYIQTIYTCATTNDPSNQLCCGAGQVPSGCGTANPSCTTCSTSQICGTACCNSNQRCVAGVCQNLSYYCSGTTCIQGTATGNLPCATNVLNSYCCSDPTKPTVCPKVSPDSFGNSIQQTCCSLSTSCFTQSYITNPGSQNPLTLYKGDCCALIGGQPQIYGTAPNENCCPPNPTTGKSQLCPPSGGRGSTCCMGGSICTSSGACITPPTVYFTLDGPFPNATKNQRDFDPGISDITKDTIGSTLMDPYFDYDCVAKFLQPQQSPDPLIGASFVGNLNVIKSDGTHENVNTGELKYLKSITDPTTGKTYDYFTWPILGYKGGDMPSIASDTSPGFTSTNPINPSLIANHNVECEVELDSEGTTTAVSADKQVTLCSHYWGDKTKRLNPSTTNGYTITSLAQTGSEELLVPIMKTIREGMTTIDPFMTYSKLNNFDYYIDVEGKTATSAQTIPELSHCQSDVYEYFKKEDSSDPEGDAAYYTPNTGVIVELNHTAWEGLFVHELGHYFDLSDEYIVNGAYQATGGNGGSSPNCARGESTGAGSNSFCSDFANDYSGYFNNSGCHEGCSAPTSYYRTTANSIMNNSLSFTTPSFNRISCTTIMDNIRPSGYGQSNWNTCNGMKIQKDAPSTIVITSPTNGKTYKIGSALPISWKITGTLLSPSPNLSIRIVGPSGSGNPDRQISSNIQEKIGNGSFNWSIDTLTTPGAYYVKIVGDGSYATSGPGTFTIAKQ